jgi:uncharacterized repeat protein (TIGR03803 family)
MKSLILTFAICIALCASRGDSQTFKTLVQFGNGGTQGGGLTLSGSTLYGMGAGGGYGTVYSVGIDGTSFQNLVSFTGTGGIAIGNDPTGGLTLSGTTLYGTTKLGGSDSHGNVFSVGVNGTNFRNLHTFTYGDMTTGLFPWGAKLAIAGTTLYGTTFLGGIGNGNLFSVGIDGTNCQNFVALTGSGGTAQGNIPLNGLTLSGSTLYGMTEGASQNQYGTVYSVEIDGTNFQSLVSFTGTNGMAIGAGPEYCTLTLAGTTLYGTTTQGGANGDGNVFSVGIDGTNFQNLLSFTGTGGAASGFRPFGSVTLSGTTLYGMTRDGGAFGFGNIFSVGIDASHYDDLHDFTGGPDGGDPYGDLTLSGGTLFGVTNRTIFTIDLTTPTPEPGTLALAGSAAALLVANRWRKRRSRR